MLLLPLLVCLLSGCLTGAQAGEPPSSANSESLLLSVSDLPTPSVTPGTTQPSTPALDGTTQPPTTAPDEAADTGGREGGSGVQLVSTDADVTAAAAAAAAAQPDGNHTEPPTDHTEPPADHTEPPADHTEPPTDHGEVTQAAASGDDVTTTAAPEDVAPTTTDDGLVTVATTAGAADGHPTTVATETTPSPPGDVQTTTPGGQDPKPNTMAAEELAETTPAGDSEVTPAVVPAGTTRTELPLRLVSGVALRPEPTLSRHRPDPGLAPSEKKQSKARTGVPDPEMLDNPSKPRKGVPPSDWTPVTPPPAFSGGLSVTEGTPVTESVSVTQAAPSTGAGFFGEDTLTDSSSTEKIGGQPAPKEDAGAEEAAKPKPEAAKDASDGGSGSSLRGSAVAGVVVLVLVFALICFFMFRKVRESWYRRHYRKMDFLVDGMYNL